MAGTPIVLKLYDPETDEIKATYRRSFIPWKLMKEAVRISEALQPQKGEEPQMSEELIDEIASLIVAVFGKQFSVEALNDGADITEMVTVLNQIVAKLNGISPNPPPAG